ncbi:MAG: hypothetical protein HYU59_05720 [Magnetospirillum gryphiswaldense]|nr:hypothetical protein [Magnetospirillum gryphiswaldense]
MYDIEKREDGWAVIDMRTGRVAVVNDIPQTGKDIQDADEMADILNYFEDQKPARLS